MTNITSFYDDNQLEGTLDSDLSISKQRENLRSEQLLKRSKQLLIFNEEGCMRAFEVNKGRVPNDAPSTFESSPENSNDDVILIDDDDEPSSNISHQKHMGSFHRPEFNNDATGSEAREMYNNAMTIDKGPQNWKAGKKPKKSLIEVFSSNMGNPSSEEESIPCSMMNNQYLEKQSITEVSVKEVHMASSSTNTHRLRKTHNKSASEMLMLRRNVKKVITSTSYEYNHVGCMDSDISFDRNNAKTLRKSGTTSGKAPCRGVPHEMEKYGPDLVPPGWSTQLIRRKTGKSAGKWDIYFITPEGKKLRSKLEIAGYIKRRSLPFHADEFIFRKSAYSNMITDSTSNNSMVQDSVYMTG